MEKYKYNNYSQNGEDGIIEYIMSKIKKESDKGLCVEFGAWDGMHMSNTFNLVKNHNFNAIYIEGDKDKFEDLKRTQQLYPSIYPVCELVGQSKSLSRIMQESPFAGHTIDVLSIDVDGMDYKIWDSYKVFYNNHGIEYEIIDGNISFHERNPSVVVIEINSSLEPTHIMEGDELSDDKLQERGVNFATMVKLGESKGYSLVAHTGNCIFVDSRFISHFDVQKNSIQLFDSKWIAL